eukprot:2392761-Pyramimonas_sp.AAC.1
MVPPPGGPKPPYHPKGGCIGTLGPTEARACPFMPLPEAQEDRLPGRCMHARTPFKDPSPSSSLPAPPRKD